jgi:hypothetical protein
MPSYFVIDNIDVIESRNLAQQTLWPRTCRETTGGLAGELSGRWG